MLQPSSSLGTAVPASSNEPLPPRIIRLQRRAESSTTAAAANSIATGYFSSQNRTANAIVPTRLQPRTQSRQATTDAIETTLLRQNGAGDDQQLRYLPVGSLEHLFIPDDLH
jgi:hypothetical protein